MGKGSGGTRYQGSNANSGGGSMTQEEITDKVSSILEYISDNFSYNTRESTIGYEVLDSDDRRFLESIGIDTTNTRTSDMFYNMKKYIGKI